MAAHSGGTQGRNTVLAVFASDKLPGGAARASLLVQAGTLLAKKSVEIVVPAIEGNVCMPLIAAASSAGGKVVIVAEPGFALPRALPNVSVEMPGDPAACQQRVAELADAYFLLPLGLKAVSFFHATWVRGGGGKAGKTVAMLNRDRAFEVMRGYVADVVSHSLRNIENYAIFSDSVEDLWNRLARRL